MLRQTCSFPQSALFQAIHCSCGKEFKGRWIAPCHTSVSNRLITISAHPAMGVWAFQIHQDLHVKAINLYLYSRTRYILNWKTEKYLTRYFKVEGKSLGRASTRGFSLLAQGGLDLPDIWQKGPKAALRHVALSEWWRFVLLLMESIPRHINDTWPIYIYIYICHRRTFVCSSYLHFRGFKTSATKGLKIGGRIKVGGRSARARARTGAWAYRVCCLSLCNWNVLKFPQDIHRTWAAPFIRVLQKTMDGGAADTDGGMFFVLNLHVIKVIVLRTKGKTL